MDNKEETLENTDDITNKTNIAQFQIGIAIAIVLLLMVVLIYFGFRKKEPLVDNQKKEEVDDLEDEDSEDDGNTNKTDLKWETYDPNRMKCIQCGTVYSADAIICLNCNKMFKWKDSGLDVWGKIHPDRETCQYCGGTPKASGMLNDAGRILTCRCGRHYVRNDGIQENDDMQDEA